MRRVLQFDQAFTDTCTVRVFSFMAPSLHPRVLRTLGLYPCPEAGLGILATTGLLLLIGSRLEGPRGS